MTAIAPTPSSAHRERHAERKKEHSALLTQLRTGKIGFNTFLYDKKVPTVLSPRCVYDTSAITVRYILLYCPLWRDIRCQKLAGLRITDLREILNSPKGAEAAIRFILRTGILTQFRRVAREE